MSPKHSPANLDLLGLPGCRLLGMLWMHPRPWHVPAGVRVAWSMQDFSSESFGKLAMRIPCQDMCKPTLFVSAMKINRLLPAKLPLYIVSCLYFRALCWHVFIRTLLLWTYSKWSSFGHCLVIVLSCIWLWKFEACPFCTWCSFTFHTQLLEASFRTGGKSTSSAFNFKIMFVQRTSLFTVIVLCVCVTPIVPDTFMAHQASMSWFDCS